jgi:hypothetical protein
LKPTKEKKKIIGYKNKIDEKKLTLSDDSLKFFYYKGEKIGLKI